MSLDSKHAYRFNFLKSEDWKGKRLMLIAKDGALCACCGLESWSNDVHHLRYPKRWGRTSRNITITLCRTCHGHVHSLFGHNTPTRNRWLISRALASSFQNHGRNFTRQNVMDELDIWKSERLVTREKFQIALEKAGAEIRRYLTNLSSQTTTPSAVIS